MTSSLSDSTTFFFPRVVVVFAFALAVAFAFAGALAFAGAFFAGAFFLAGASSDSITSSSKSDPPAANP